MLWNGGSMMYTKDYNMQEDSTRFRRWYLRGFKNLRSVWLESLMVMLMMGPTLLWDFHCIWGALYFFPLYRHHESSYGTRKSCVLVFEISLCIIHTILLGTLKMFFFNFFLDQPRAHMSLKIFLKIIWNSIKNKK
jgi:hypothetical protein